MSRDELRSAAAAEVDRWEQALTDELVRLFDRQERVVLTRLQGTKARKHTRHWEPPGDRPLEVKGILDKARWVLDAVGSSRPLVTRMFTSVYGRVAKALDPDAADPDPDAVDKAVEARLDLIAKGIETAQEEVEALIKREEDAGTPMPQIVSQVRDLYADRKPSWAARIATVSAVGTINQAGLMAAAANGSSAKQWLSRRDSKVRETHEHADGQVRLLDERFRLGGPKTSKPRSLLMFPGDPAPSVPLNEIMNCRCTLLFSPPRKRQAKALDLDPGLTDEEVSTIVAGARNPALEEKARRSGAPRRVRTVGGAQQYGQAIGTVIRRDVIGSVAGVGDIEFAGGDPAVRTLIAKQKPSLNLRGTDAVVLRDHKDRVSAYVVWDRASGVVMDVSVHPSLRGQRIGDQLVAAAVARDPNVKPPSRGAAAQRYGPPFAPGPVGPTPGAAARYGAPFSATGIPAPAPARARGQITDRSRTGDLPGTSGDFDADAKRIERLQKAYLADKVDTTSLHSRGGRWSRAREAQQQEIIDHFLSRPGVKSDRKLLVLGGLPGAGKTTTINSPDGQKALGINLEEYVVVNADEVKAEMVARGMVPDYPGLSADEAATLYHAESFEVAHSLMRQAAREGKNFAYDTSLKSTGQLGFATGAGQRNAPPPYETTMLFVDVPVDVAKDRAKARYLGGGRYMPLGLIDGMRARGGRRSSAPAENFDSLKGQVDRWAVFDNSGATPMLTGQGGRKAPRRASTPVPTAATPATPPPAAPAAAPAATSGVPAAPAGAQVWQNRSGKVIHVLPDGTVQAYKADGTPARTTADAAKLADGYGDWKQVGGPPPSASNVAPATQNVAPATQNVSSNAPSGPINVPPNLPAPPPGARVFAHPQGKHIYLLSDGSLVVYKPDGKRGTSSATAAKLLAGYGGWSELGGDPGTPLAATPAPAAPALVAAPTAPLQVSAGAPAPSGALPVAPMDFNEAPLADVPRYIADDAYVFQQKVDGIRGVLVIEPGKAPWFASKKGDRLVSSTAAQVTTPMLAKLPATPPGSPAYRVEGEILNGKFHVFDMVVVGQESTPYESRQTMADAWVAAVAPSLPQVTGLPTARTTAEKQALWDQVLASGAEGVMMKRRDAGYQGGQRVNHTLKAKITATADVVVLERNRGGKDNAVFGMLVNGKVQEIGTVSTGGKDKALGQINVGDVLEVEYLWASAGSNTLTQPRIIRKRKDKTANDATDVTQLRFVDKTVLAMQAKAARLQLEHQIQRSRHAVGS